ncbi:MAG: ribose 5-phosphate isomerase A [Chloroflexota bacterium]
MSADEQKQAAAEHAATLVEDEMVVGLGSGSTAERAIRVLGRRYTEGLRFRGVPTSKQSAQIAQSFGIPLLRLDELSTIDITIDGADEVDPHLNLIKGHGGALAREKLVASAARAFVVIVDESKLVELLGTKAPIPVEVLPFGWTTTRHRLESLGLSCELRGGEHPYVTSNHNYILDCRRKATIGQTWQELGNDIKLQTGVVDHGLFLSMANSVVVGSDGNQVRVLR